MRCATRIQRERLSLRVACESRFAIKYHHDVSGGTWIGSTMGATFWRTAPRGNLHLLAISVLLVVTVSARWTLEFPT